MSKLAKKLSVVILTVLLAFSMFMVLSVNFSAKADDPAPFSKSHLVTKGAAIRLDKEPNGIRFPLLIKTSDFATYSESFLEAGMIFAPEALYDANEFTVDVAGTDGTSARKVVNTNGWAAYTDEDGTAYMAIMVTITGIPESQLAQRICFVGYVKTAEGVVYTDVVSRSIAEVAYMYIQDKGAEAEAVAYDFIPGGAVEQLDEQEFEVYSGIDTTSYALSSNTLTVDLSNKEVSAVKFAKIVKGNSEYAVDVTVADGIVSIAGTEFGSSIYGDCELVLFTDTCTVSAPLNIITKKVSTLNDMQYLAYYGGLANNQYDGYFVMTQDINAGLPDAWYENKYTINATPYGSSGGNWYSIWDYMGDGFKGVFDGQGYMIKEFRMVDWNTRRYSQGLFGAVAYNGVIKNLAIDGWVDCYNAQWYASNLFGIKFCGSLQNCYIDIDQVAGRQVNPIASNTSGMRAIDVVIKVDASKGVYEETAGYAGSGYICSEPARYSGGVVANSAPKFENVHAFVKEKDGQTLNAYTAYVNASGDLYGAAGIFATGLTKHGYDDNYSFTVSKEEHAKYWNLNAKKPTWHSIPVEEVVQGADFEVYNSIVDNAPVANTLSIDLADGGISAPESVVLATEKASTTLTTADYSVSDGILTISGDKFGASVYGAVSVNITQGKNSLTYKTNVITKKISSDTDMKNLAIYGGVLNDQTTYNYDGYYVLTKNIECNPTVQYAKATGWNYVTTPKADMWNNNAHGFMGVFDGQGFSIKNVYFNNYNACSGGLFGNVHSDGIVKNLGVSIIFRNTKGSWANANVGLAYKFSGKLENCYVEVCGEAGANIGGETYPIAKNASMMKTKDVVIKADLSLYKDLASSNNGVSYFCGEWAPYGTSNNYRASTYTNVYAFVKEPEGKTVNLYTDYYGNAVYTGAPYNFNAETAITKYAYDATIETPITFTSNAFWTTNANGQPVFASMVATAE